MIDAKISEMPSSVDTEELLKRRVPCVIAFLHPFRVVQGVESASWNVTIEDVNRRSWDYVALHDLVGGVDVGLAPPYHMVVGRDGCVALPVLSHLRNDHQAVEFFNRCFAAILLGGIYCEAISLDFVDFGSIIDWKYIRVHTHAAANRFHLLARLLQATPLEAVKLVNPRMSSISDLTSAAAKGYEVLTAVPELSGEFLLKGVTGIARRDWGAALANLWIVVEQLTSNLWERHVMTPARDSDRIPGRVDQLSDSRSWTIANRHELLHQIKVISHEVLLSLTVARKARNALSHDGKHPTAATAQAAYVASLSLLQLAAPGYEVPLAGLDLTDHSLSDPFTPSDPEPPNPTHWMPIPKLPGESELERLEAHSHRSLRESN